MATAGAGDGAHKKVQRGMQNRVTNDAEFAAALLREDNDMMLSGLELSDKQD
jgi:hypothetical protein